MAPSKPEKAAPVLLPSERTLAANTDEGWTIASEIKGSSIPQAGNGRFVIDAVPAGTVVFEKKFVDIKTIHSLHQLSPNSTVAFNDRADLEKFVSLSESEGGHSREAVLAEYEHFIWGIDGKYVCLNYSTWTSNHGEPGLTENVKLGFDTESRIFIGVATRDIAAAEELYMNYRDFKIPEFYSAFCREHGFKDVRTAVLEAVDGDVRTAVLEAVDGAAVHQSCTCGEQRDCEEQSDSEECSSSPRSSSAALSMSPQAPVDGVDGGDWAEFDVSKWRDAISGPTAYHHQLYKDTTDFIRACGDSIGGASQSLVVEMGSGTGDALLPLSDHFKYCVGIDFNPTFVNFSKSQRIPEKHGNVRFITGDACELGRVLACEVPEWSSDSRKVVTCVGNTIGIMPAEIREAVYQEAARVAGKSGIVVMVYWNGHKFGDAVQHFYHANPQLCGEFDGSAIDLSTCTLTCPSGYTTHWTTPEEARSLIEGMGLEVVSVEESSDRVGVMVAYRIGDQC